MMFLGGLGTFFFHTLMNKHLLKSAVTGFYMWGWLKVNNDMEHGSKVITWQRGLSYIHL